ncbi:hypothetical protein ACVWXU_001916 [Streptomyces sp. TE33382]
MITQARACLAFGPGWAAPPTICRSLLLEGFPPFPELGWGGVVLLVQQDGDVGGPRPGSASSAVSRARRYCEEYTYGSRPTRALMIDAAPYR